jgi:hypothetical protein
LLSAALASWDNAKAEQSEGVLNVRKFKSQLQQSHSNDSEEEGDGSASKPPQMSLVKSLSKKFDKGDSSPSSSKLKEQESPSKSSPFKNKWSPAAGNGRKGYVKTSGGENNSSTSSTTNKPTNLMALARVIVACPLTQHSHSCVSS